ncbi:YigZ family protein [Fructilactobacillus lindneri]|uniref:IMPACT family member yvyE n=2 Tax=Fructilactobacillus lindneri TaxID=53444 RepID=A0A0R2JQ97_9LACO|nr:YigZ family protein [Fructilactobacillus lindneri]ANZ58468.1 hypothetical protein AYR60_06855 [Fructilactobacillus lindneri]ANZ59778.1 hypothetical protein AYR59_07045 [Fructilactobacillus lindneri]KRN79298.1 IMPACT family member yvyE [Fructilactobacillus lindneri DSM 20690 = JCM 11027]POG98428.1 YigZ family protein [Fructilactobacillus lindneri]POH03827.1 YigZ family protein [Fructilactobacillus lindneri]
MENKFLTIANSCSHEIDIKKSKFIASISRVNSEKEAKEFIQNISLANKKANHNCFAYLSGKHDEIQRESDNGEPSGTAGVPILEVLKKNNLHDTAIVVTRYFGGIKLGAGGLIRAYSNSASQVIEQTGIVEKILQTRIKLTVSYKLNDKLQYFLQKNNFIIYDTQYGKEIEITTAVAANQIESFQTKITNLLAGDVKIKKEHDEYFEIPYRSK